jgi:hypothetical protein
MELKNSCNLTSEICRVARNEGISQPYERSQNLHCLAKISTWSNLYTGRHILTASRTYHQTCISFHYRIIHLMTLLNCTRYIATKCRIHASDGVDTTQRKATEVCLKVLHQHMAKERDRKTDRIPNDRGLSRPESQISLPLPKIEPRPSIL